MDYLKIYEALPLLENYDDNVVEWMADFSRLMRICNIDSSKQIYNWAYEAVGSVSKRELKLLVEKKGHNKNEAEQYPTIKEIQKAVEKSLGITDGDKLAHLQGLKIKEGETIKGFNDRYRKLYHDLPREFQKVVTVKNYRNSISTRSFPYSQVFTSKCDNLQDAYIAAETAEEAEKEWNKTNNTNAFNSMQGMGPMNNVTMISQGSNFMKEHMFSPRFNNNRDNHFNYNRQFSDFNNNFSRIGRSYRNRTFGSNIQLNQLYQGNDNGYNQMNNNQYYGNYNGSPLYNNINNPAMDGNRINNFNERNNYNSNFQNYYNYNRGYNYNHRNNVPRNFNRGQNIPGENDAGNNAYNGNVINNNNTNDNNKHEPKKEYKSNIATITCHRCFQQGHKSIDCQYSFKQLAEMEEKGLLNKPNNLN
ncbi:MAG: hypothetical protein E7180_06605 [Erysipelotrichaceae bacterium]|nr:hypothetical protein [Erysipelotrichaceae bacterium]